MKAFIAFYILIVSTYSFEFNFDADFYRAYSLQLNKVYRNGNVSITLTNLNKFKVVNNTVGQHLNFTINYEIDGTQAKIVDLVRVEVFNINSRLFINLSTKTPVSLRHFLILAIYISTSSI
jgi:hypothetical protein